MSIRMVPRESAASPIKDVYSDYEDDPGAYGDDGDVGDEEFADSTFLLGDNLHRRVRSPTDYHRHHRPSASTRLMRRGSKEVKAMAHSLRSLLPCWPSGAPHSTTTAAATPIQWARHRRRCGWCLLSLALAIGLVLLFFNGVLVALGLMYVPRNSRHNTTPQDCCGIRSFTEQVLVTDDPVLGRNVDLVTWFFPASENSNPPVPHPNPRIVHRAENRNKCVIVAHGHGVSMAKNNRRTGERAVLIKYIHPLVSAGFNVLALDQRNHGQSDYAPPITFGWYESRDLATMIDWLLETHPDACANGHVALWGESMGAATAILAASRDPRVTVLVEDSSYMRILAVLATYIRHIVRFVPDWWVEYLHYCLDHVSPVEIDTIDLAEAMKNVTANVLIAHGYNDSQIPFSQSEMMYEVAKARPDGPVTDFFPYIGDHVRGYETDEYQPYVVNFIENHLN